MAAAIDRSEDAARLRAISDRVRRAFNDAYVKEDGTVGSGSQTGYILALKFELLPEGLRSAVAERLVTDIRNRGGALTTGMLGTQFSLDVLADSGFADLAYDLLLRAEYPSWGYMIAQGGTTIWETWDGETKFADRVTKSSQNHFAFGSICAFILRRIAGIDAGTPGFEEIVVRPVRDERVRKGGGDYDSIMGRISTQWWHHTDGGFSLRVTVPANTTARIHLPAAAGKQITESGSDISSSEDLRLLSRSASETVLEVGSGSYQFVSR
jgi:alpha-L-rhamnosidase